MTAFQPPPKTAGGKVKTAKGRDISSPQVYDLKPMHLNDVVQPVTTPPPKSKY